MADGQSSQSTQERVEPLQESSEYRRRRERQAWLRRKRWEETEEERQYKRHKRDLAQYWQELRVLPDRTEAWAEQKRKIWESRGLPPIQEKILENV